MNSINSRNLSTNRLDLRIPSIVEQHRLWEILVNEEVNQYYFPTPDRIFIKNNLSRDNINDLQKARKIFMEQLSDWSRQEPFYEKKIEAIQAQDENERYTWSIFLKGTNTVIGQITCQPKDNESLDIRDIGWFIDPAYQGQGYAYEAAVAMLEFMFNEVEISEVSTSAADINLASWKLMEKLGFEFVGMEKSTYIKDDEILTIRNYLGNKESFLNRLKKK